MWPATSAHAILLVLMLAAHAAAQDTGGGLVSAVLGSLSVDEGAPPPAHPSPLKRPFGVDFDAAGNMYIVELEGGRVHKFDRQGRLSIIAGNGMMGYAGDGGPAKEAVFNGMHNLAIAPSGKLYVSDSWNHCIREIDLTSGTIRTVAGTGEAGFSGDGGPASNATFDYLMCVSLNPDQDEIYIADLNNRRIRVMDLQTQRIRTVAGNGQKGVPGDGDAAIESPLVDPRAVAVDSQGRIYILERSGHSLRRVDTQGRITTVAGTGTAGFRDGPAAAAQLNSPKHLCLDDQDRVYIADDRNAAIRRYDPASDTVTTLLGRGRGDERVRLKNPHGVTVRGDTLYVVDTGNDRILRLKLD